MEARLPPEAAPALALARRLGEAAFGEAFAGGFGAAGALFGATGRAFAFAAAGRAFALFEAAGELPPPRLRERDLAFSGGADRLLRRAEFALCSRCSGSGVRLLGGRLFALLAPEAEFGCSEDGCFSGDFLLSFLPAFPDIEICSFERLTLGSTAAE